MKIASILENHNIEKRIAITPEIVKKYTSLGFEILLSKNYGSHLGILDSEYSELGVQILDDDDLPEWVQSKIAVAAENIGKVYHYLDYKMKRMEEEENT